MKVNISKLIGLKIPLILASSSPRRKQLLKNLGFKFEIIEPNIDEDSIHCNIADLHQKVIEVARAKANTVARKINKEAIVLGADTIVAYQGEILSKPITKGDAIRMLKILSNHKHIVFTGICLLHFPSFKEITDFRRTEVAFRELADEEIAAYVNSGSPLDKAGAYGIQDDFGAVFVKSINGCYYNVVGLPLECFYSNLKKLLVSL